LEQHEHGGLTESGLDLAGGDKPFVGVGGWHADVEDRHVGPVRTGGRHGLSDARATCPSDGGTAVATRARGAAFEGSVNSHGWVFTAP
jgi:hypothetical protein